MKFDPREIALICFMLGAVAVSMFLLRVQADEQPLVSAPHPTAPVTSTEADRPQPLASSDSVPPLGAIRVQKAGRTKPALTESPTLFAERPRRRVIIQTFPPAPIADQPATAANAAPSELQIDLAPGVREPLALTPDASELLPQQLGAVEGIANDFADRIEQAADTFSEDEFAVTWDEAQADADAQYHALLGAEAFNRKMADVAAAAINGQAVEPDAAAK